MSVILFLASLFPAPFSRNQMMNEKVQERTRRGEERRTFLFFLLHPDRSPIPRFGGMSDLTREERGITGSPAFAWLATQRQPLQSPQFQPRVNDSRLLIIEFSQIPYRAVSELQGRLVVSRVVKDHIFFYLDQRSRSMHQRSRSLLKDQDPWQ